MFSHVWFVSPVFPLPVVSIFVRHNGAYISQWYLNKMGHPNFRSGAHQRTTAKRLQIATWRLYPTGTVCGQHATLFFRPSIPPKQGKNGHLESPLHGPPHFVRKLPGYTSTHTPFSAKNV